MTFLEAPCGLEDWEEMLLMNCCKDNIIANSSFSWWGAYLNDNINKIVCYPSVWFGPAAGHMDTKDLCPDSWNKIWLVRGVNNRLYITFRLIKDIISVKQALLSQLKVSNVL